MVRRLALGLVSALLLSACATGPRVGIRDDYRGSTLTEASVVPFFTRSAFGLERPTIRTRIEWAERAAVQWLAERGVGVAGPRETRQRLEAASEWSHFSEGGIFRRDLAGSYESAPRRQRRETQVSLLTRMHRRGTLDRPFVLFGQFVYQTTGTCRTRADETTARAEVVVAAGAPESMPRPCIVSHFQARLVDASTGETVWYNRRLRELHPPMVNETWVRRNVRAVVRATLSGRDGLGGLLADETG